MKSTQLSDLYKYDVRDFDIEGLKNVKQTIPVVYADAEELVSRIIEYRNLIDDYHIKVLADGGQGSFKICISLIPDNYNIENENGNANEVNEYVDSELPARKRSRYCEGGVSGQKAKLTSINRLIILCKVPKNKETYGNLETLFQLTKLNNILFKFVVDLADTNGKRSANRDFDVPISILLYIAAHFEEF